MIRILFVGLVVLLFSDVSRAQNVNLAAVSKALSDGNVTLLSNYLDNSVEIALVDSEEVYSKAEAFIKLQNFFRQNKPQGFAQVHQGVSKGKDSHYCIGNLITANGDYRVYIFMRKDGGNYLIQELRFNRE